MAFFDFLKRKELQLIADLQSQLSKYQAIIDAENEAKRIVADAEEYSKKLRADATSEVAQLRANAVSELEKLNAEISTKRLEMSGLATDYESALATYKALRREVSSYESKLDFIEYGIYEPVYDFERSEEYRAEQNRILEWQKVMIANDTAAVCPTNWQVEGSESKGRAVVKRYKKLMLRAFNGECDALIAKVKWNNVGQMQERLSKLYDAINKLGENFNVTIVPEYKLLKQKELILEYEYQAKRQKEKEEMRAVQEEIREEEKARREFEQAQRAAEKEEANYLKALEKARREVEIATGDKQLKLQAQIELLQ